MLKCNVVYVEFAYEGKCPKVVYECTVLMLVTVWPKWEKIFDFEVFDLPRKFYPTCGAYVFTLGLMSCYRIINL